MIILKCLLIGLGLLCLPVVWFCRSLFLGSTSGVREFKELEDMGIESHARLTYLEPFGTRGYASAVYEIEVPGGDNVRKETGVTVTPDLVIGDAYPIVRHHQLPTRSYVGTMEEVVDWRKTHERAAAGAKRLGRIAAALAVASLASGVLIIALL
ncbi:hypothetical protein [Streptomyces sp. NPDC001568]|uniref:hypothetical protein n=1 Tax=Streptomyces sp. NPDC001568 TaxID=3364588 RepID=UPI00368A7300